MIDSHKKDSLAVRLGYIMMNEGLTPPEGVELLKDMIYILEREIEEDAQNK